jgi:hypothetical protein
VGPTCQRQCRAASSPDWLLWAAVSECAGWLKSRSDSAVRTAAVRTHARAPDRATARVRLAPRTASRPPLSDATRSPGPKPTPSRPSHRRHLLHRCAARCRSSPSHRAADVHARPAVYAVIHASVSRATFSPPVSRASVRRRREAAVQRRRRTLHHRARHARSRCASRAALAGRAGPRALCRSRPSWAAPAWPWAALAGRASAVNTGHARVAMGRAPAWPRPCTCCASGPSVVSAQ